MYLAVLSAPYKMAKPTSTTPAMHVAKAGNLLLKRIVKKLLSLSSLLNLAHALNTSTTGLMVMAMDHAGPVMKILPSVPLVLINP